MAPPASTGQEANPKVGTNVPRAIQLVMAMSEASPALTIEEQLRKMRVSRDLQWITAVVRPSMFIVVAVGFCCYKMFNEPTWWRAGFPRSLPVVMLVCTYLTVVQLAMGYMTLFLPRAPFAAREALDQVGFRQIGFAVIVAAAPVVLFDQAWLLIASACLLGVLVAAVVAFWVCLVRTYGQQDGQ